MDDDRLKEIESRLNYANKGPWSQKDWDSDPSLKVVYMSPLMGFDGQSGQGVMMDERNAPLVTHAPIDIRDLLAHVRELKNALKASEEKGEKARRLAVVDGDDTYELIMVKRKVRKREG